MRLIHYISLFALLITLALLYDYHKTTFYKPQSSHAWRQSDCATFALNYYKYNRFITHPRLNNRMQGDGYMVGEFTGLYYLSAQLYKIFGVHDFIPRFLNLLIFFLGLLALFKMTYEVTNSIFFAYVMPLLFFSAPILTYYGNNFLPDVSAFSFILMGWAFFMDYFKKEKVRSLYFMAACFALGGLLKVTMMISVVALMGIFVLEWLGWAHFKREEKIFKHTWHTLGVFAGMVVIVGLWYVFARLFNQEQNSDYFLSGTLAAWQIDRIDWFTYTLYKVFYYWSGFYFFTITNYLILFLSFFVLLGKRYVGHFLYAMTLLTFIGSFLYFQLFFYQFRHHGYYVIPAYTFVIFVLLSSIVLFKRHFPHIYNSVIFKGLVVILLAFNIGHADRSQHKRYFGKMQEKPNEHLYDVKFQDYLKKQGIDEEDLVVSLPDYSPNWTLYLMNRPGFTSWLSVDYQQLKPHHIQDFVKRGAQYMIIHDKDYHKTEEGKQVEGFKEYEVGDYKGIKIYDLKPYR